LSDIQISGHSAVVNAVAISPNRPFRAATVADDTQMVFYHGPPYRFNSALRSHSKFVYDVAFSPDGKNLVSVGADAKIFLYDGKTGESKGALSAEGGHTGSIFAVGWDKSSSKLVTASADQSIKLWDVTADKVVQYRPFCVVLTLEHGLLDLANLFLINRSERFSLPPQRPRLSHYLSRVH
jgi:WD40 repeat protein